MQGIDSFDENSWIAFKGWQRELRSVTRMSFEQHALGPAVMGKLPEERGFGLSLKLSAEWRRGLPATCSREADLHSAHSQSWAIETNAAEVMKRNDEDGLSLKGKSVRDSRMHILNSVMLRELHRTRSLIVPQASRNTR